MPQTIGIVGLGLIGGSFAKTIRAQMNARVLATDIDEQTLKSALETNTIDAELTTADLAKLDILILALKPRDIIDWLESHAADVSPHCIIFDVAGVKRTVVDAATRICDRHERTFIGAHPMAGHHEGGFVNSSATLFDDASFIMCPTEASDLRDIQTLENLAKRLGFKNVVVTTSENHDEMIAFTSQLAHIVSSAYIKDADSRRHSGYSAGSFQDMTRVAILDTAMWSELCCENADMLLLHLDTLQHNLDEYRAALRAGDEMYLKELFTDGLLAKHESMEIHGESNSR